MSRLAAVQAQDERGFRLAVRSRSDGLVAADVDAALTESRSLVVTWLNRGTLHLVTTEDYWWLHPITAPRVVGENDRRLRQLGVSDREAERGIDVIVDALAGAGPLSRPDLRRGLEASGVPCPGQIFIHLVAAASLRGLVVRGPVLEGAHAYVLAADWLGRPPRPLDADEAHGRLARRYLAGHGPASARDLAAWSGITLADARRGLAVIADEVAQVTTGGGPADAAGEPCYRLSGSDHGGPTAPPPRLLGPFDPLLHGWRSRELTVGDHGSIVTTNGIFRPVALVRGRAVATWTLPGGIVTIDPLEELSARVRAALAKEAADVQRFLGLDGGPAVFC